MGHNEPAPPFFTTLGTLLVLMCVYILGKVRDLITACAGGRKTRKGYAPIRQAEEDFYDRRVFSRIKDCWNRPIASAPGAWIDVMDRDARPYSSGFHTLSFTGKTRRCVNLGSYNYLGFAAADPYCTPRVQATMKELGVSACSSRTDTGTTSIHVELERAIAKFVGCEAATVYGMGYATNSAVIPVLVGKGCLIISDALNHASIVAGARSSGAKVKVFRHNDAAHLDATLRACIAEGQPRSHRPWKKIVVIVEGIYSMEGDTCALRDIVAVKKKYGAYLYLDEAHSIGALGQSGRGCCQHWGVDPRDIDVMMGTFTKSFGSCGGYIAGSPDLIRYLKRHGPNNLYAAAISPGAAQQILSAIKLIDGEDGTTRGLDKVQQLHDNANYFRRRLLAMGLHVLGGLDSPVMPIMIYHSGKLPVFSRLCLHHNVAMVMVGFPATPVLLVRARVCISAAHTRQDLDYALEVIEHVASLTMVKYRSPEDRPAALRELQDSMVVMEAPPAKTAALRGLQDSTPVRGDARGDARPSKTGTGVVQVQVNGKAKAQNGKHHDGGANGVNGKAVGAGAGAGKQQGAAAKQAALQVVARANGVK